MPTGQRQLPLLGLVAGIDVQPAKLASTVRERAIAKLPDRFVAEFVMPRTESEVDFRNVEWVGQVKKPLTNKLAMWVIFMLFAGGLHFKKVAELVGMTPGKLRTIRTRGDIPVDRKSNKLGNLFDLHGAQETFARSGYFQRLCNSGRGVWFWLHERDRAIIKSCRDERKQRHIEVRSNTIEFLKGSGASHELEKPVIPFAKTDGRIGLDQNARSSAHA